MNFPTSGPGPVRSGPVRSHEMSSHAFPVSLSASLPPSLTRSPSNGGGAAWEMLKSTNDPAAYMTATAHALQRHQTLRQSEGKKDKLMTRLSQTGTLKRHLTFRAETLPEMKPKIEGLSKIVDPPKPAEVKP